MSSAPRRWPNGIPIGALILVAVGALLLLQTTGIVSWDVWGELWRFWPVAIIAIGISLLLGGRRPWLSLALIGLLILGSVGIALALTNRDGVEAMEHLAEPLGGLRSVDVHIGFGAGELVVRPLPPDSPNLVEARFEKVGAETSLKTSENSGDLHIAMENRRFFRRTRDVKWDIALSRHPSLSIELGGGAAEMNLDLRELQVANFKVDTGASDVKIAIPARAGNVQANIAGGAANIDIIIPEGVAARIRSNSALSSIQRQHQPLSEVER